MLTKSAILFLYVACVAMLMAGLTCSVLVRKKKKTGLNASLIAMIIGLFVMCMYDMGIYFWNYVIGHFSSMEVMRLGSCIIATTTYLWISVQEQTMKKQTLKYLGRLTKKYIVFYVALWIVLTMLTVGNNFYTLKWVLLTTDIIFILGVLSVTTGHIIHAAVANEKFKTYYMIIVTTMIIWNYMSYFWGETSVYWGNSKFIRAPLDMTVIFWLCISIMTLIFVYKTQFVPVFLDRKEERERERTEISTADRIEMVCKEHGLTPREKQIVEHIYSGRSNKEIAEILFLSESTVKTHIYNIFRKMEIKSRVEVICIINDEENMRIER